MKMLRSVLHLKMSAGRGAALADRESGDESRPARLRRTFHERNALAADAAMNIVMLRAVRMLHGRDIFLCRGKGRAVRSDEGKTGTQQSKSDKLLHDDDLG